MAADLSHTDTGITVQLCGDAHVLNFGLWNTPERTLAFDLRDFDETLPGPFEWDVKRFVASLVVLARSNNVSTSDAKRAVSEAYRGYREWIGIYARMPEIDVWYDQVDVGQLIEYTAQDDEDRLDAMIDKQARKRSSRGASKKLTNVVDGQRMISEDPPFRTHALAEYRRGCSTRSSGCTKVRYPTTSRACCRALTLLMRYARSLVSAASECGCSSPSSRNAAPPIRCSCRSSRRARRCMNSFLPTSHYANNGERVVHGQRMIQSATDSFVGWTTIDDMDFYVRQFRDGKVIPLKVRLLPTGCRSSPRPAGTSWRGRMPAAETPPRSPTIRGRCKLEDAFMSFAFAYADQNDGDHAQLVEAIDDGTIEAVDGWPA